MAWMYESVRPPLCLGVLAAVTVTMQALFLSGSPDQAKLQSLFRWSMTVVVVES